MSKVEVTNVSKVYDLNTSKKDKIISLFSFKKKKIASPYFALRNVTFSVEEGDSVGIIGLNGSGKSTLSNLIAEVTQPTAGTVKIEGRSSLIAISAGLNNELTGEENIRMKCLMHGLTEQQINERFQDIVDFSELDKFIYQPIKSYSSGMRSRLGFAIAIHTEPDVLIVDEALSVGDETFSNKCIERMKDFQKQGKTIFFVSHSASQIKKMCDKALWLNFGEVVEYGECNKVIHSYVKFMRTFKAKSKEEQIEYKRQMIEKQQQQQTLQKESNTIDFTNILTFILLFGITIISSIIQFIK
ncbi:ABC transporter ATP-binding protein [Macrococcoides goetzii]|uniref:ABC transporter ATP-binding protein n=1 Tax=Macrococcoides goetzii TaxID=1891097 RepID=A0A2G5NMD0_9STAP|nr:ABC transporter ATP-binding protein [Macrococcus goetzii]RAI83078.1 ABC transporter ATP-binding protein [Macrococcus goetzii]